MSNAISVLVAVGLLSTGLEGVLDSVDVAHDGDSTGLHEEHHAHPHDPYSPDQPDSDGHSHYCHCGLHLPPLFALATLEAADLQHADPVTISTLRALALGPPPLPPPIA